MAPYMQATAISKCCVPIQGANWLNWPGKEKACNAAIVQRQYGRIISCICETLFYILIIVSLSYININLKKYEWGNLSWRMEKFVIQIT